MILRNPFKLGNAEMIETPRAFLDLFCAEAVEYINEDCFQNNMILESTPGAGKSSMFRLLTPSIQSELYLSDDEDYEDCKKYLSKRGLLNKDGFSRTLGVLLSSARNYGTLEDLLEPAQALQVFMNLIEARVITASLKGILQLYALPPTKLDRISFKAVPEELMSISSEKQITGKSLYDWATEYEGKILDAINSFNPPPAELRLGSFSTLKLFKANNIILEHDDRLFDISRTIIMFDDVHLLTANQRKELLNGIVRSKTPVAVWFGERTIAPTSLKDLTRGTDGKNGRDFEIIRIEKETNYQKMNAVLPRIADMRLKAYYKDSIRFKDSLINKDDDGWFEKNNENLVSKLLDSGESARRVDRIVSNNDSSAREKAIQLKTLEIVMNRNKAKMRRSLFEALEDNEQPDIQATDLEECARLYLSVDYGMPYYFGAKNITKLASSNIQQYLSIAGEIFERYMAKEYVSGSGDQRVSPEVQQNIVKDIAHKKYDNIAFQYANGDDVTALLQGIFKLCESEMKLQRAAYKGGAFTGFGIQNDDFLKIHNDQESSRLKKALESAVSSNHLMAKQINQDKSKWVVFYLNRLYCAMENLPLAYGGWKPLKIGDLAKMFNNEETS